MLATTTTAVAQTRAPASPGIQVPPGYETSAAHLLGWGQPNRADDFDARLGPAWRVYEGRGHLGNGRRTPEAVDVDDGIMTITGEADGDTAGMGWFPGQRYGRWEGRVRVPPGDETYHALLLLWPDAEDWPIGGEVDFMEITDPTRQRTHIFLHYGWDNSQISGEVRIDATRWHNWAVEWTPDHVAAFVDGREWWRTEDRSVLPRRPMHLCIQLDWFPGDGEGRVQESIMQVDWVRQYPLREAVPPPRTAPPTTPPRSTPSVTPSPTTPPRSTPSVTPSPTTPPRSTPSVTPSPTTPPATVSPTPRPTTPTTTPPAASLPPLTSGVEPSSPPVSATPTATSVPSVTVLPAPSSPPMTTTPPATATSPQTVVPPTRDVVPARIRARLAELVDEFRTLLVAYLPGAGSGR